MKVFLLALSLLIVPAAASAQESSPDRKFMLEITAADLQIIGAALEQLPFKSSAPVIQRLNEQLKKQAEPAQPAAPAKKK